MNERAICNYMILAHKCCQMHYIIDNPKRHEVLPNATEAVILSIARIGRALTDSKIRLKELTGRSRADHRIYMYTTGFFNLLHVKRTGFKDGTQKTSQQCTCSLKKTSERK